MSEEGIKIIQKLMAYVRVSGAYNRESDAAFEEIRAAVEALVAERDAWKEQAEQYCELCNEAKVLIEAKAQVQQEPVNYTKLREAAQRVIENAGIKGDQMEVDMDVFRALEDAALEAIK